MIRRLDRRGLRGFLDGLGLAPPLDTGHLVERLTESRGRPLRLIDHPIQMPGPFGCWIATPTTDYVVYQRETTPAHQAHIVLHELGHIIAGHDRSGVGDLGDLVPPAESSRLIRAHPEIDRDSADRALTRNAYTCRQEREAESIATILTSWSVPDPAAVDDGSTGVLGRLEASMRDTRWT
ncbi:hypothetical protein WCD74_21845 [Actinomycetospora sp. OC33-EN08]|uniref:IrrE N-terminal-like domain-containing protein n=1 Tax=Actinomycetospora aurantiaca TaxID=3129233 RepID=A0ABU8MSY4_9PSEU